MLQRIFEKDDNSLNNKVVELVQTPFLYWIVQVRKKTF